MQIANIQDVLNRIDILIVQSGMTKQDFYSRSGISSGSFSQWNTGTHSPSIKKLQCAADTLNVPLNYILYGEDTLLTKPCEKSMKKEAPGAAEGLSDKDIQFVKWFRSLSPEKQKAILIAQDGPVELAD